MQTFRKKKIEIIIEAPALKQVIERIRRRKTAGYTVLPVLAGSGHEGSWESAGSVSDSGRMVAVMCILDESELHPALEEIYPLVLRQIGIITISDVEVIRSEHF